MRIMWLQAGYGRPSDILSGVNHPLIKHVDMEP